jgi:murein DD-endopeptidase MepM/ murein hydrolase activator NlpD
MIKDNSSQVMLRLHVYICQVCLAIFCYFLCVSTTFAISLDGIFKQGGFIVGKLAPEETSPSFNGITLKKHQIGADGTFIFGIGRNTKPEGLIIFNSNNNEQKVSFIIEPRTYETQAITGVPKRKVTPNPEDLKQIKADKVQILKARSIFTDNLMLNSQISWPVSATITGVYGSRRTFNGKERSWHKGLDIAASTGEKIYAPTGGVVRLALANSFYNGNLIIIDHGHQLMTIYAHLNEIYIKNGDTVTPKTVLGTVGSTGRSTGPHLHWGLYWRNMALDPLLLMKE